MITGQIITRPKGPQTHPTDGRHRIIIVGVLAVDQGHPFNQEGMQFTVAGSEMRDGWQPLLVKTWRPNDVSDMTRGNCVDGILMAPIWQT